MQCVRGFQPSSTMWDSYLRPALSRNLKVPLHSRHMEPSCTTADRPVTKAPVGSDEDEKLPRPEDGSRSGSDTGSDIVLQRVEDPFVFMFVSEGYFFGHRNFA